MSNTTTTVTADRRPELRAAFAQAAAVVASVRPEELGTQTPCDDWDVAALVDHVVYASRRAAGLSQGRITTEDDAEHLEPAAAVEAIRRAAADAAAGWTDSRLTEETTMPWGVAYTGFALVDMYTMELVTHAWDLAHAVGRDGELDDTLAEVALDAGRPLAPPEYRGDPREGMPFAPETAARPGGGAYGRLAAFLGRDPR